jgi:hypothetical protein
MTRHREERLTAAATNLALDTRTVEVVSALEAAGIRTILLKGPAIARWLYAEGESRRYADIDLLVDPRQFMDAERLLADLGFVESSLERAFPEERARHAHAWRRAGDATTVDLHRTIAGAEATPLTVWKALDGRTERLAVGERDLEVLEPASRAFVVALHAAYHRLQGGRPLKDLERAVELLPPGVWAQAGELAAELDARPAFAQGLGRLPAGAAMLPGLGLSGLVDRRPARPAGHALWIAQLLRWLEAERGLAAKATFMARAVVPPAALIRRRSALARRGRAGLVAAYAWRVLRVLRHIPSAVAGWRRAKPRRT